MRYLACALVAAAALAGPPAFAQTNPAAFWKTVEASCAITAARPASETAKRIAQTAIDDFKQNTAYEIDASGRLFHFGLTEAEHEEDDGGGKPQAALGHAGWQ